MIILSMYDRTANGEAVSTSVTLDIDAIGVPRILAAEGVTA